MKQASKKSLPQPGRPRPLAVRLCAVRDYLSGMTQKEVCEKYDLPDRSVISLWKRKYATNITAMKKKGHKKRRPALSQLEESWNQKSPGFASNSSRSAWRVRLLRTV